MIFELLQRCQLKMNPLKCTFGVIHVKFLGFIIYHRGIDIDQPKIKAIKEVPKPKNLEELRGLHGHLAYLQRFISNLTGCYHPLSHLMEKGALFEWNESWRLAFEKMMNYLSHPLMLGALIAYKRLILYIAP